MRPLAFDVQKLTEKDKEELDKGTGMALFVPYKEDELVLIKLTGHWTQRKQHSRAIPEAFIQALMLCIAFPAQSGLVVDEPILAQKIFQKLMAILKRADGGWGTDTDRKSMRHFIDSIVIPNGSVKDWLDANEVVTDFNQYATDVYNQFVKAIQSDTDKNQTKPATKSAQTVETIDESGKPKTDDLSTNQLTKGATENGKIEDDSDDQQDFDLGKVDSQNVTPIDAGRAKGDVPEVPPSTKTQQAMDQISKGLGQSVNPQVPPQPVEINQLVLSTLQNLAAQLQPHLIQTQKRFPNLANQSQSQTKQTQQTQQQQVMTPNQAVNPQPTEPLSLRQLHIQTNNEVKVHQQALVQDYQQALRPRIQEIVTADADETAPRRAALLSQLCKSILFFSLDPDLFQGEFRCLLLLDPNSQQFITKRDAQLAAAFGALRKDKLISQSGHRLANMGVQLDHATYIPPDILYHVLPPIVPRSVHFDSTAFDPLTAPLPVDSNTTKRPFDSSPPRKRQRINSNKNTELDVALNDDAHFNQDHREFFKQHLATISREIETTMMSPASVGVDRLSDHSKAFIARGCAVLSQSTNAAANTLCSILVDKELNNKERVQKLQGMYLRRDW